MNIKEILKKADSSVVLLGELKKVIQFLTNKITSTNTNVTTLQNDLTTAEGDITTLEGDVLALETANEYKGAETLIGSIDFGAGAVPLYRRLISTVAPNPATNTLADLSGSFAADYISRVLNATLLYPEGTTNVAADNQAVIRPQAIIYDVTTNVLSDNLGAGGTYLPAVGEAIHVLIEYTKQ